MHERTINVILSHSYDFFASFFHSLQKNKNTHTETQQIIQTHI